MRCRGVSRCLSIRQAARLLAKLPPGEGPLAFLEKTRDRPLPEDEIDDPFHQRPPAARVAVKQLDAALGVILLASGAV